MGAGQCHCFGAFVVAANVKAFQQLDGLACCSGIALQSHRYRHRCIGTNHHVVVATVFFAQPHQRIIGLLAGLSVLSQVGQCICPHQVDGGRGIIQAKNARAPVAFGHQRLQLVQAGQQALVAFKLGIGKTQGVLVARAQRPLLGQCLHLLLYQVVTASSCIPGLIGAVVGLGSQGHHSQQGAGKPPPHGAFVHGMPPKLAVS